jgi:hypothetical protein
LGQIVYCRICSGLWSITIKQINKSHLQKMQPSSMSFIFYHSFSYFPFEHTLLEVAFNDKCRDYLAAYQREGISFIPLPVENLGGWHKKAVDQLRKPANAQARNTDKEEDDAIRHLFQCLGELAKSTRQRHFHCSRESQLPPPTLRNSCSFDQPLLP